MIDTEYKKLGSMKQGEYISLFCFIIVVIMWVAREPTDGSGWAYLFPVPGYMTDGMVVILVGICLFVLPIDDSGLFCIFNRFRNDKISISKRANALDHTNVLRAWSSSPNFDLGCRAAPDRLGSSYSYR